MIPSWVREHRWYKEQRRQMEFERPPLSDAEFLRAVPVGAGEEALWLAVRRVIADSLGLPSEAIYPEDRMADLWRMRGLGTDLLDIIFRLERSLGVRISPQSVDASLSARVWQEGDFRKFAASLVRAIGLSALGSPPPQ